MVVNVICGVVVVPFVVGLVLSILGDNDKI